ncbi:hypothetical protein [Melghirimyces algeriensis]|uniref:Uncharacterized protein n=1 Tax=Melghirimyces algeriensis TaxID=910412 RepID=A0A521EJW8_9BACL|nr:hypothetical protein [Melghirimyces algeriensis]SMO84204.1 hypothetical protein SAMN06264849_109124 [Melghirimyces algeriensis]
MAHRCLKPIPPTHPSMALLLAEGLVAVSDTLPMGLDPTLTIMVGGIHMEALMDMDSSEDSDQDLGNMEGASVPALEDSVQGLEVLSEDSVCIKKKRNVI